LVLSIPKKKLGEEAEVEAAVSSKVPTGEVTWKRQDGDCAMPSNSDIL
jgi:hypothetical protein